MIWLNCTKNGASRLFGNELRACLACEDCSVRCRKQCKDFKDLTPETIQSALDWLKDYGYTPGKSACTVLKLEYVPRKERSPIHEVQSMRQHNGTTRSKNTKQKITRGAVLKV